MLVSCPTTNPPAGVLYNHLSKTGGTSLTARFYALKSPDMPLVKAGSREEMRQIKLGRDGALVIQVDTQPIQVSASDAARFFVIGLVRRPCDYALSIWSFSSDRCLTCTLEHTAPWNNTAAPYCSLDSLRSSYLAGSYGDTPPYTSAGDLARFDRWVLQRWKGGSLTSRIIELGPAVLHLLHRRRECGRAVARRGSHRSLRAGELLQRLTQSVVTRFGGFRLSWGNRFAKLLWPACPLRPKQLCAC